MKKLMAIVGGAVLAGACVQGCGRAGQRADGPSPLAREVYGRAGEIEFSKVALDGHEYVVARGVRCVSALHSESCPCRSERAVRFVRAAADGREWLVPECGRGAEAIPLP